MSNLKKILALVLALVMSFSLVSVSSAAFKDEANITDVYAESADVLATLGVFKGYEDGSFNPKGSITRAEVAAIIYRVATGDVTDKQVGIYADYNVFSDVKSDAWYAGYVNYCANAQYIKGYGNGKFGPNDTVTGYQALAMILRAVGYDKNGEFTGPSWQVETAKIGNQLKITRNVNAGLLGVAATREVVAEILFRAINVPTVTYTLALGYNPYEETIVVNGDKTFNQTLGQINFGLEKQEGVMTAFGYEAKSVTLLGEDSVLPAIVNVEAGLDDIGNSYYVYTVPTAGKKTLTAVSDLYPIGNVLLTSTDGTTFANLLKKVTLDPNGVAYYINGYSLPEYYSTLGLYNLDNPADPKNPTPADMIADLKSLVAETGVKVSFIDTDNQGKAEVVSVIHYDATMITAITNDYNTGINGVQANSYYLGGIAVKATDLITADELAYQDYVTYVEYRGNYYVDEVDYVTGKLEAINRALVLDTDVVNYAYVVDGADYFTAEDYTITGDDALVKNNLQRTIVLGLDPYGYVLSSARYYDESNYLFVVDNEHTKELTGLTETMVVFADGTTETINVAYVDTDWYFGPSGIDNDIYRYTTDANGNYYLSSTLAPTSDVTCGELAVGAYTKGRAQFGTMGLNSASVVVDLRSTATWGKVYVGHTGENAVPSMNNVYVHYKDLNEDGIIELAYLLAGESLKSDYFVAFTTGVNKVIGNATTGFIYLVDVLIDGELVKNYELSEAEYNAVAQYGVGEYTFDRYGNLTFYAFNEMWEDATWGRETLTVHNEDGTNSYYAYNSIPFKVINVGEGEVIPFNMAFGYDGMSVKAIPMYNSTKTAVTHMYVIADPLNTPANLTGAAAAFNRVETLSVGGYEYQYAVNTVAPAITMLMDIVAVTDEAKLADAMAEAYDELDAAIEEYNTIAQALIDAGYTGIVLMAEDEETVDVAALIAKLEAAKAKVEAAIAKIEKLAEEVELTPAQEAEIASVKASVEEVVDSIDETIATVGNQDLKALFEAGFTYEVEADVKLAEALVYAIADDADIKAAVEMYFVGVEADIDVTVTLANGAVMPEAGKTGDVKFTIVFKAGEKSFTAESTVTVTVKAKDTSADVAK